MLDDLNDVEDLTSDIEVCVMHIPMRWSRRLHPHFTCLNCPEVIARRNKMKQNSCCSGRNSTNFHSNNRVQWEQHLRIHLARREEVPKEAWELELE